MSWIKDKQWSDIFLPEIKRILGEHLISEPPIEEDQERNTDLMVLKLDAVRIGCRVRRHKHLHRYGGEFTIRAGRPSGAKTELTKIVEGWGQYFFYGFSNKKETCLEKWTLIDLNAFRLMLMRYMSANGGKIPGLPQNNQDDSSDFLAFQITEQLVFAQSEQKQMEVA